MLSSSVYVGKLCPMTSSFHRATPRFICLAQYPGDPNKKDWQGLIHLKPSTRVLVQTKRGAEIDGKFRALIDDKMILSVDGELHTIDQGDLQKVYVLKARWSRETTAITGWGIGLVIGAGVARKTSQSIGTAVIATTAGALAGGGFGALLGGNRKGKLLYEANKPY